MAFAYSGQPETTDQAKGGAQAADDLEKWAVAKPAPGTLPKLVAEHALISGDLAELEKLVNVSLGPLLYTESPVRIASKDGALALLLTSVGSHNVYNTLRLDARQRAQKEVVATVLPAIRQFGVITSSRFKFFGVLAVYGTRDFSDEGSSPKGESVALVAPVGACRKLAAAEMTEEDFVAVADIYIVESGALGDDVRKVRLTLGAE